MDATELPDGWALDHAKPKSKSGWINFKISRKVEARRKWGEKRNFWLAFNGHRLSDSHDTRIMQEHFPNLAQRVITLAKRLHADG